MVWTISHITAHHENMKRRQLPDHLTDQVGELAAIRDPIDQGEVLLEDLRPVHTMHARVVEEVSLESPRLHEELSPLPLRIYRERPAFEVDPVLGELRRRLFRGLEHQDLTLLKDQQMLPLQGELVAANVFDQNLLFGLLGGDLHRLQVGLAPIAIRPEKRGFVQGEATVVAGRNRRLDQTIHDPSQLDLHLDLALLLVLFLVLLLGLGTQLIFGLEGRDPALLEGEQEDLHCTIQKRLGLTRPPRRGNLRL